MGKTICCNCNKEIGRMQFKFSYSELWDVSSHPKVAAMNSDDKLCSNCKKMFDDEINQSKEEMQTRIEIEPDNVIKPNITKSLNFCPKCGKEVIENASFCVGCGLDLKNVNGTLKTLDHEKTLPAPEVVMTKSKSWAYKFQLIMGIIVIFGGAAISNYFNVFFGIVLVIIGFVSLKNKSKTIDQFLTIASLIVFGIAMIALLQ